jgi:magnesium transporter
LIRLYGFIDGGLKALHLETGGDAAGPEWDGVAWVDLLEPDPEEKAWVERVWGIEVPSRSEMRELEASSRCYQEADSLHLLTAFIVSEPGPARTVDVWFNLHRGRLFTVRPERLSPFRLFRLRAQSQPEEVREPIDIPLGVVEAEIDVLSDVLEASYARLERVSRSVLTEGARDLEDLLEKLAAEEDLQGKTRLVLLDLRRSLTFLLRYVVGSTPRANVIKGALRDIESLTSHSGFVFEKIKFLMDATMGFINLEQNKIIKIFSIAAVVFLPPTLVASIYGMNFHVLPELSWPWGYPFALVVMLLSGIAPYWLFKRKGWL